MIHLTIHQLSSYIDRELPESSTELVRRHLDSCEECTRRFGDLQEQEAILNQVLVHDPGAAFFVHFPDLVLEEEAKARESARGSADRRAADRRVEDRRVTERRVGNGDRRGTADRRGGGRADGGPAGGTTEGAAPTSREVASDAGAAPARPIVSWKPVAPEEVVASGVVPAERATRKSPGPVAPPAPPVAQRTRRAP
ncbi:MAG: zf-HC2 domain-containing protein, partial [Bacteroidota bacterium]